MHIARTEADKAATISLSGGGWKIFEVNNLANKMTEVKNLSLCLWKIRFLALTFSNKNNGISGKKSSGHRGFANK